MPQIKYPNMTVLLIKITAKGCKCTEIWDESVEFLQILGMFPILYVFTSEVAFV